MSVQPLTTGAQAALLQGRFHLLLGCLFTCGECLEQLRRTVGIERGRIEQAEQGEALLVGLVRLRRRERLHPGPQLLEKGQLVRDGCRCRDAPERRRGAVRFEGQLALQHPDRLQVGQAIASPRDRAHPALRSFLSCVRIGRVIVCRSPIQHRNRSRCCSATSTGRAARSTERTRQPVPSTVSTR